MTYHSARLRRVLLLTSIAILCRCAAPAPEPMPVPPMPEPVVVAPAVEEKVIGTVRVTASALNVRREASTDADVVMQVKKGEALSVLADGDSWLKVRLANGEVGWVAERFVTSGEVKKKRPPKKTGCPADSDYAFLDTPMLAFSDSGAHGVVIVDATVNARGNVIATKIVSNSTRDEALAFLAEREIRASKFSPPIRNCAPRAFIFTYRRTF
jgi:hypothetical protein